MERGRSKPPSICRRSVHHHRRSGALAAGAGEPGDERHGRDGRDHLRHVVASPSAPTSGGRVDVSVRDNGTGLPTQVDGALFTPFVTTKAHGLGIGFTIARTIVRPRWHHRRPQQSRRGRDIHGHPAPQSQQLGVLSGRAECCVTARAGRYVPKPTARVASRRPPRVAKAVCRVLSLECEVVGTVADGIALLAAAQRLQPDVIVVDLNLPEVHGLEVCRQIRQGKSKHESHRVHGDE